MVDMSAIASALSALNAAKNIAESMIGLRDSAAFQSKLIEFQSKILDAQNSAFAANDERAALIERVRELEARVAELEAWEAEKKRYHLKQLQPGVTVYALKEGMEGGEDPHYLCPTCYNRGQKSILQQETQSVGRVGMQVCHGCGAELIEHGMRQESPRPRGRRR